MPVTTLQDLLNSLPPAAAAFAEGRDEAAAALLNGPETGADPICDPMPRKTLKLALVARQRLLPILASDTDTGKILRYLLADPDFATFDPESADGAGLFSMAIAAGLITDADKLAIRAITARTPSYAEVAFGRGRVVTTAEISALRAQ